jgi:glycosyltransferase domain-containing protein
MSTEDQLTILLTLKDRGEFTHRWMSYAQRVRLPFKVLIADGGYDASVSALLAERARFPNVDYEYLRYPEDTSYSQYYAKIDDALGRVRTPFVAMADNDDFLVPDSLARSVEFLIMSPDYAACGGQCAQFWVVPDPSEGVSGLLYGRQVDWKFTSNVQSSDAATAAERLHRLPISIADPLYYDVKRTGEARRQFKMVRQLNLTDLFLVEHLVQYLTVIAGKTKRFENLLLARQHNSPGSSGIDHQRRYGDWMGRMLVESWSGDFAKFLVAASEALAAVDRISLEEARDCVVETYRKQIAPALLSNLLEESTVTLPMLTVLPAVRRLVGMPEDSPLKRGLRWLYRRLRWISLDAVLGTELFTSPSATADRDFRPIREFLASKNHADRNPTSGT